MLKPARVSVFAGFAGWWLLAGAIMAQQGSITTGGNTQLNIFVRGRVAVSDGNAPPGRVGLELVCQGQAQPQGKTDADGSFYVQLGANRFQGSGSAEVSSSAAGSDFGGALSGRTQLDGASVMSLMGCFLRGVLEGYRSEQVDLGRVRAGDDPNVGTIILHRLGDVQEATVSSTALGAPKAAKKALDKARENIDKRQFAGAEKELRKAVQLYPKYAEAWQDLGAVLQNQNRAADARKAYLESIASDSKFVLPHLSLARLSATERNWQDSLDQSAAVTRLDPTRFPAAYYYAAVAHYNLDHLDQAIENARQAVKLDSAHAVPLAEQLLGVLFSTQGDYKSAAEQFRNYLQHVPPTTNVEPVKALLAEAEKRAAQNGSLR